MTGFGKERIELPNKLINIEIKALNSKQLDMYLRLPNLYKEKDPEIRQFLSRLLERGKIELFISIENSGDHSNYSLNKSLAIKYYEDLKEISEKIGEDKDTDFLSAIVRLPDILVPEQDELNESEWDVVKKAIISAIDKVNDFRIQEGKALQQDILKRINLIENLQKEIEPLEKLRIIHIKEKIKKNLIELFNKNQVDENRFEQELIYYLEKLDITEENVRLIKHIDYFKDTIHENDTNGKKLIFISQEIGREINTIGSKANDAQIQKIVVVMKNELEKIKEQLFNIL